MRSGPQPVGAWPHPVDGLHESSVHTSPSSQSIHAWMQPLVMLQESSVHELLSSQFGEAPPTHEPFEQVSSVVHALPSLQAALLFVCRQPIDGLQESSVHGLAASQSVGV